MGIQQMLLGIGPGVFSNATGGTKSTPGDGYIYHLFTTPGTFTVNGGEIEASNNDALVVGGGGGGGGRHGGGGGAGGYINSGPGTHNQSAVAIPKGAHTVTIGQGGNGSRPNYEPNIQANTAQGCQGGDTSIGSIYVAAGGGWGGDYDMNSGNPGGSGGGAGNGPMGSASGPTAVNPYTPTSLNPGYGPGNGGGVGDRYGPTSPLSPAAAPNQGNNGGNLDIARVHNWQGCGGGGANAQGGSADPGSGSTGVGGDGGNGIECPWAFPTMGAPASTNQPGTTGGRYFCGGGGGGGPNAGDSGNGGGGQGTDNPIGGAGTDGSGGGGGGTRNGPGDAEPGGPGGNGVVLIRYPA